MADAWVSRFGSVSRKNTKYSTHRQPTIIRVVKEMVLPGVKGWISRITKLIEMT